MYKPYITLLLQNWEMLRASLGVEFDRLAPDLLAQIEVLRAADNPEVAALAEANIEDWVTEHAPEIDEEIRRHLATLETDQGAGTSRGFDYYILEAIKEPVAAPSPVSTVTRYTDISCPRRVWLNTERLSVFVRLTVAEPTLSAAVKAMNVRTDAPVAIRLTAPAFDILSADDQTTPILPDQDSPPVVFDLKPSVAGPAQIVFDFRQAGNPVGTAVVDIEVTGDEVATSIESRRTTVLEMPQDIDAPDLLLYIHYDTSHGAPRLIFNLEEAGRSGSIPFEPIPLRSDPATYAADLYRTLSALADDAGRNAGDASVQGEIGDEVRRLGYKLWREVIPRDLKERYMAHRAAWEGKTLLVLSDEPYIPWELVWPYDATTRQEEAAPWSVSLRLLRWLRRDAANTGNTGPFADLPFQSVACVAPTNTGLQFLEAERAFLLSLLPAVAGRDVSPSTAARRTVLDLLRAGGYDWLHVVTHGVAPHSQFAAGAIELEDDTLRPDDFFGPDEEGHIGERHPGFVLNLCHGGRQVWGLTHLDGWANALVRAGAGLVVAPLWAVTDRKALTFVQAFYASLLGGAPVAEAVYSARQAIRSGDPTWLAYSVYAHPNARVRRQV